MKRIGVTFVALAVLSLSGCGGSSARNINGIWIAQLKNPDSSLAYSLSASLAQGAGSTVSVSRFEISGSQSCFAAVTGQTATFTVTGRSSGFQTGPFGMTVSTAMGTQVENVLTLTGTRGSDGTIHGAWTVTGLSGCNASGNFTMTVPPPV